MGFMIREQDTPPDPGIDPLDPGDEEDPSRGGAEEELWDEEIEGEELWEEFEEVW